LVQPDDPAEAQPVPPFRPTVGLATEGTLKSVDLKQLEYFVRVAEFGSFSKAAAALRLPQPSLSRHVRKLELGLRQTLFERTGRGVQLTDEGRHFYEHAMAILQLVSRAQDDVETQRGKAVGRVAVGMPPSIGRQLTPGLIESFKRQCPQARLSVVEGLSTHLMEWIATGRLDLALLLNPDPHESITTTPLLDEALCLVTRPGKSRRITAERQPMALRDLPRFALILPDRSHTIRRLLETQAALAGIHLDVAWEVSSIASIIELVARGHGHAVLTASAVANSAHAGEFVVRPLMQPQVTSTLCLGASTSKRKTPLVEQVAAMLTTLVGALPRP
jgi:LysR family transcriptional regulator, nitrogen assimilation regulatory protein